MHDLDDPSSTAPAGGQWRPIPGPKPSAGYPAPIYAPSVPHHQSQQAPAPISGTSVWARIVRDTMDAMIIHLGGEDQVCRDPAPGLSSHRGA